MNIRLFPEQLAYVINHGEDKVVFVDDSLVPLLAKVASELTSVECFVIVGDGECDASLLGDRRIERYSELLAHESPDFDWPEIDERQASAMCYTSGTTGNPKGVVVLAPLVVPAFVRGDHAQRVGPVGARSHPHDRADVPRQRVGHSLRGVPVRRVARDARAGSSRPSRSRAW